MKSLQVYRCFCDETRLRILNLLLEGPLCVCHLTAILEMEQPKVSRHLKALKEAQAVDTERCYNWTIYRLPENPNAVLDANLRCLQDLRREEKIFARDLKRRKQAVAKNATIGCENLPQRIRALL
ncbi:MAG: winged helix-turn-helix transcriptional regulator [Opitutales bacterium]|nr:winged helix-turn-helix transcriptional regulator [Opitutales bacterium]MCH8540695.1 metalloregulator ArsR/SmtB family transcription factor [Opitutales bacterium]